MNMFVSDDHLDGSHQSHFIAGILQNGFHQVGGRGLALGTRDTDNFQFLCRMAEPGCGDKCHGISGIRYFDHSHIRIRRKLYVLLYHQHPGALCSRLSVEEVAGRLGLMKMDQSQLTYIRLDSDSVLVRRESAVHQWTDFLHDGAMTILASVRSVK